MSPLPELLWGRGLRDLGGVVVLGLGLAAAAAAADAGPALNGLGLGLRGCVGGR